MINQDVSVFKEIRQRHAAMALVGFCAFLGLNMTQPLLPMLRSLFHVTAGTVSMTVGGPILAVAVAAPLAGMFADTVGRKRSLFCPCSDWRYSQLLAQRRPI